MLVYVVQMREALGDQLSFLRALFRALLAAGSKTYTHTCVMLERYSPLLQPLLEEAGHEGAYEVLDIIADVWHNAPQRLSMTIDR